MLTLKDLSYFLNLITKKFQTLARRPVRKGVMLNFGLVLNCKNGNKVLLLQNQLKRVRLIPLAYSRNNA